MFEVVEKKSNIKDFKLKHNSLMLRSDGFTQLLYFTNNNKVKYNKEFIDFGIWDKNIFFLQINNRILLNSGELPYKVLAINNEHYIHVYHIGDDGYTTILSELRDLDKDNNKIFEYNGPFRDELILSNFVIVSTFNPPGLKQSILCTDIFNQKSKGWSVDLVEIGAFYYGGKAQKADRYHSTGELRRIIGVANDILWIALTSGRLLGLLIKSGEIIHNISVPSSYPSNYKLKEEDEYLYFGEYMQLDKSGKILFGLRANWYWEIPLNVDHPKDNFILYDIEDTMLLHEMRASMVGYEWSFDSDYIYFGDSQAAKIGVFDRFKREVVWSAQVEVKKEGLGSLKKLEYADGKLYVLDRTNVLHIYERIES
ncbi:MAG TPA: hypothetical protein PKC76_17500 [Saprospiraceae bacterium]|nr:hypothetical protein [Saprospiraceae bacterium]